MRKIFITSSLLISFFLSTEASASCSREAYMGSTCITAASYCPRDYLEADGRILPISKNQALFSLLGDKFGGDGRKNFALPNLTGAILVDTQKGKRALKTCIGVSNLIYPPRS